MDTVDEIMSKDRTFTGEVKVMRVNAAFCQNHHTLLCSSDLLYLIHS